jgi:hypothetical protein
MNAETIKELRELVADGIGKGDVHLRMPITDAIALLDEVEALRDGLQSLIDKKRRQADMADHEKANEYGRGAASAMRVVSDEMADLLPAARHEPKDAE